MRLLLLYGPASPSGGLWPLKPQATPLKLEWRASIAWNMPRPGGQTPKFEQM